MNYEEPEDDDLLCECFFECLNRGIVADDLLWIRQMRRQT